MKTRSAPEASDQRELLASLTPEFQRVLLLLDVLLEGSPPVGVVVQVPSRPLLEDSALLNRLMELLSNGDGAAVDLLEESSASLRVILGEATLQRVAEAINDFDFDEALEVLGETSAKQRDLARRIGRVGVEFRLFIEGIRTFLAAESTHIVDRLVAIPA
ncbi:hypothetical protein LP420_22650 [Massilia sp. B-10]|nr:hypothetical protein LP420_22650 [Massilia sp. B-10]